MGALFVSSTISTLVTFTLLRLTLFCIVLWWVLLLRLTRACAHIGNRRDWNVGLCPCILEPFSWPLLNYYEDVFLGHYVWKLLVCMFLIHAGLDEDIVHIGPEVGHSIILRE